jgi:hypothetical protein
MSYSDLPKELQSQIINQLGPRTMVINKSVYNLRLQKYCQEFDPTETQILNYIDKANRHGIPYVQYELQYRHQKFPDNAIHRQHYALLYTFIGKISNVDANLIFQYKQDDDNTYKLHDLRMANSFLSPILVFGDHQYYDLDLFSLYQLGLEYCHSSQVKQFIRKRIDWAYEVSQFYDNYPDYIGFDTSYYPILLMEYIYIVTSAMILNLTDNWFINYEGLYYIGIGVKVDFDEDEMIEQLKKLCPLLYNYFNISY